MHADWVNGLGGGLLIGAAAAMLLLLNGRIAGVSGILGGLLSRPDGGPWAERAAFVAALLISPLLYVAWTGGIDIQITTNPLLLVLGGLLVGFGARRGAGCTSGHGVCGASRLSTRSIAATATFLGVAVVIATLIHGVL